MALIYNNSLNGLALDPYIYYGNKNVHGIYYGTKLVYPSPKSYSTDFKFGQTSTVGLLEASNGIFQTVNDGPIYQVVDANGVVGTNTTGSDKIYAPYSFLHRQFNKYEISVSIYLNENLTSVKAGLVLGRPMNGRPFVTLEMVNGLVQLLEGTGRDDRTVLMNMSNYVKPVANDKITLARSRVNSTEARYVVYVNDVEKASTRTPLNMHGDSFFAGILVGYQRHNWRNYYAPSLKNFSAHTF